MTAPVLMTDCPTEETLAAYIDDRLDHETRNKVTDHLASCGECREIVLMTTDFQESEPNVRYAVFGRHGRLAAVAGLAAAAALAFFVLQPTLVGPDVDDVKAASLALSQRPFEGRFSGGLPHQELAPTMRGAGDGDGDEDSDESKGKFELYRIAGQLADAKFPNSHAVGVVDLLLASKRVDFDNAVAALDLAYEKEKGTHRDAIAVDLAVALLARGNQEASKDYTRALDLSNEVLKRKQIPEAAWNRAVALEFLERDAEAIRAWDDYLKLDPSSDWATEARERKTSLTALAD